MQCLAFSILPMVFYLLEFPISPDFSSSHAMRFNKPKGFKKSEVAITLMQPAEV